MAELIVRLNSLNNHSIEVRRFGDKAYIKILHNNIEITVLQLNSEELFEFGALLQSLTK